MSCLENGQVFSAFILVALFLTMSECNLLELKPSSEHQVLCNSSFCPDTSWPDPETVLTMQVYGSAIALDKENNIILLHRSTSMNMKANLQNSSEMIEEDVIMILHPISGKVLRTWGGGKKFVRPHGIEITDKGDIFITDVKMHQVFKFKFNATSRLWNESPVLTLGKKFISGNDQHHFCSPADVAVLPSTMDFFVADGYCNSRIVKFSASGTYLNEFQAGSANSLSPHISFNITHAIKIAMPCGSLASHVDKADDQYQSQPVVLVADRNNARIQTFAENGTFLYEIGQENFVHTRGMLFSLDFISAESNLATGECSAASAYYGKVYAVSGNLPVGQAKIFEISVGFNGYQVINSFSVSSEPQLKNESRIETPHDIAVSKNGQSLYVIEAKSSLIVKRFLKNFFYANSSNLAKSLASSEKSSSVGLGVIMVIFVTSFVHYSSFIIA